jgi:hypothetical protein
MKAKVSKTLSNMLLLTAIIIGFVMTFISKDAIRQFYFFLTSVLLISLHCLFVFLGTAKNKKAVVDILDKVKDTGLAEAAVNSLLKKQTPVIPINPPIPGSQLRG